MSRKASLECTKLNSGGIRMILGIKTASSSSPYAVQSMSLIPSAAFHRDRTSCTDLEEDDQPPVQIPWPPFANPAERHNYPFCRHRADAGYAQPSRHSHHMAVDHELGEARAWACPRLLSAGSRLLTDSSLDANLQAMVCQYGPYRQPERDAPLTRRTMLCMGPGPSEQARTRQQIRPR